MEGKNKIAWWPLYVIAAVAALALILSHADERGSRPAPQAGGPGSAEIACKDRVRAQLRAPSTARFRFATTEQESDGAWFLAGTVSSQNGFGATVDTGFTCALRHVSGEVYSGSAELSE